MMTGRKRLGCLAAAFALCLPACSEDNQASSDGRALLEAGADARLEAGGDAAGDAGKLWPSDPAFRAGFAVVKLTPSGFEGFIDRANNGDFDTAAHTYKGVTYAADAYLDSGVDGKFDFQEAGAFGADGKPGKAGVDDDGDGVVDDLLGCHPADDPALPGAKGCEYLAAGSDDKTDPAGDNYHKTANPKGTEKDGKWQNVVIGGYGGALTDDPIRPAQGVHDDIWARAMVVSRGGTPFAVVSVDLPGYMHVFGNPARRAITARTGIPAGNIVYAATHSHDAPDTVGIWAGPNDMDMDYIKRVNSGMEEAVAMAVAAMKPATMRSATSQVDGCYDRTTLRFKPGSSCSFPVSLAEYKKNPSKYDAMVNQIDLRDPMVFNHSVTALLLADAQTGNALGTLVSFANHPEVLGGNNNQLSSDYPHHVRQAMEARYGGTCVFLTGACGGQMGTLHSTPVPLYDTTGKLVPDAAGKKDADGKPFPRFAAEDMGDPRHPPYDKIRSLGYVVAGAAIKGLEAAKETASPQVVVKAGDLDVPVHNALMGIAMLLIEGVAKANGYMVLAEDLPVTADYCPSLAGRKTCIRVKVVSARVGDVTLMTAPGEPSPEYLLGRSASTVDFGDKWGVSKFAAMPALTQYTGTPHNILMAIANGYLGYLTPEAEYLTVDSHPNYYEEIGSVGKLLGDTVGNKLLQLLGAPSSVTFNAGAKVMP